MHHGTIGARLHRRAPIGPRLHRRVPIRDCAVTCSFALQGGILSNTGGKDGRGAFREDSGRVWCCWGYRPSLFSMSVDPRDLGACKQTQPSNQSQTNNDKDILTDRHKPTQTDTEGHRQTETDRHRSQQKEIDRDKQR